MTNQSINKSSIKCPNCGSIGIISSYKIYSKTYSYFAKCPNPQCNFETKYQSTDIAYAKEQCLASWEQI